MDVRTLKEEAPVTVVNGSGAAFYVGKPGTDKASALFITSSAMHTRAFESKDKILLSPATGAFTLKRAEVRVVSKSQLFN